MDIVEEMLYQQAEEVAGYQALSLQAMAVLAWGERKSKNAMRVFSFVWGRNARHMARAVVMFGDFFETNHANSVDELLSMFAIASLEKRDAATIASDWKDKTLAYWQVRERVDALKQKNKREPKEKSIPLNIMALFIENLQIQAEANYDNVGDIGITLNQVLRDAKAIIEQAR